MNITEAFKKINFVSRYQLICEKHNDSDNGLRGNNINLYDRVLNRLGYTARYFKKARFYKTEHSIEPFVFTLHLVLKDGLVEPLLYVMKEGSSLRPRGRFDGVAEELQEGFREKYTIPKYTSEQELEQILREIFSIYEDLKREILKSEASLNCVTEY